MSEPIQSENINDVYAFFIRNPTGTQLSYLSVKENSEFAYISMPSIHGRPGRKVSGGLLVVLSQCFF